MALKDKWVEQTETMDAIPDIPNMLADAIIELEEGQGQGGNSILIDETLLIRGAAADAYVTGDEITKTQGMIYVMQEQMDKLEEQVGDTSIALDNIIALQEQYINYSAGTASEGGDSE